MIVDIGDFMDELAWERHLADHGSPVAGCKIQVNDDILSFDGTDWNLAGSVQDWKDSMHQEAALEVDSAYAEGYNKGYYDAINKASVNFPDLPVPVVKQLPAVIPAESRAKLSALGIPASK